MVHIFIKDKFSGWHEIRCLHIPDKIEMLLDTEIFYGLLRLGQIYSQRSKLSLHNTVFGYMASNCVKQENDS